MTRRFIKYFAARFFFLPWSFAICNGALVVHRTYTSWKLCVALRDQSSCRELFLLAVTLVGYHLYVKGIESKFYFNIVKNWKYNLEISLLAVKFRYFPWQCATIYIRQLQIEAWKLCIALKEHFLPGPTSVTASKKLHGKKGTSRQEGKHHGKRVIQWQKYLMERCATASLSLMKAWVAYLTVLLYIFWSAYTFLFGGMV